MHQHNEFEDDFSVEREEGKAREKAVNRRHCDVVRLSVACAHGLVTSFERTQTPYNIPSVKSLLESASLGFKREDVNVVAACELPLTVRGCRSGTIRR